MKNIINRDFKLTSNKRIENFRVRSNRIEYNPRYDSVGEDSMRMILLHEYGHTKYPAYFHLVMKILYVVAGIFCALLYLLYVSLSITIIQLTVISFVVGVTFINILFFRLKHYLEQDEYNADFWAAWAFTQLFDGKASEVLNDTLIELEKIKMEYYSNNKYQAWISSVKTKLSGHLDPHPNVDDRVKYIQNWFQE